MNLRHRLVVLCSCLWFCLLGVSPGAEPAARRPQPDRWLLIVDTSAAMERRAQAVEGVAGELIVSGMNGQMHTADELGIWSFNKQLYAGVMPLQTWQPARSNFIAGRSVVFIGQQVYHHKANLEPTLAALRDVLRASRKLTVVLISDGAGKMTGTPFDQAINEAYARHAAALGKTRMPLVTVLRGYKGAWIGQSVSIAPWPVVFPPFPPEPEAVKPAAHAAGTNQPAQPVQSIFISASNSKSESAKSGAADVKRGAEALIAAPKLPVPETVPPKALIVPVQPLPLTVPEPTPPVAPVELAKPAAPVAISAPPVAPQPGEPAAAEPALERPLTVVTASAPAPAGVAPMVASALPETVTPRKWPLVSGIIFMWVAILVALALARRTRRAHATSLITRSLDPHAKSDGPKP